jgi:hypothetical protein
VVYNSVLHDGLAISPVDGSAPPEDLPYSGFRPFFSGDSVAFRGNDGLYVSHDGQVTRAVREGDAVPGEPFGRFKGIPQLFGVDVHGVVAFTGQWEGATRGYGAFVNRDGTITPVAKMGGTLFDQPVTTVLQTSLAIDPHGSGRVVFGYRLANGVTGIAMATPVPEPAAAALAAAALLAGAARRRGRHAR